ncbi:MAG: GNAT family N-acetyltransferase [Candidatus Atribacteria bacterium]|nr:GNAT family N-acetyltransferase [Candidatus Atribacteria bacterium]
MAQQSGLLCGLRFKSNLVGGTLCYLHQNEAYMVLIGHDPQQDSLNLGNVSMWLTIEWLIKMGIKRCHLLWGKSFYKTQFGAKEHALFEVTVFRNPCVAGAWNTICLVHDMWFRTGQVARALARRIPWTHS